MSVEALILVKTVPGNTLKVVRKLAVAKKTKGDRKMYALEGVKHVYRASGEYDVIVHVSVKNSLQIFDLIDRVNSLRASPQNAVSETQVITLCIKVPGDP